MTEHIITDDDMIELLFARREDGLNHFGYTEIAETHIDEDNGYGRMQRKIKG